MDFDELGHTTDTQNSHRWQFVDLPEFNVALSTRNVMSIFCQVLFNFRNLHYLRNHFAGHWIYKLRVARIHRLDGVCPFRPKVKSRLMLRFRVHCCVSCPILQHYTVLAHNQAQLYTTGQHKCTLVLLFYYQLVEQLEDGIMGLAPTRMNL